MKTWGWILAGVGVVGAGFLLYKAVAPKGAQAVAHTGPTSHQSGNDTAQTITAVTNAAKGLADIIHGFGGGGSSDGGGDSGYDASPEAFV